MVIIIKVERGLLDIEERSNGRTGSGNGREVGPDDDRGVRSSSPSFKVANCIKEAPPVT